MPDPVWNETKISDEARRMTTEAEEGKLSEASKELQDHMKDMNPSQYKELLNDMQGFNKKDHQQNQAIPQLELFDSKNPENTAFADSVRQSNKGEDAQQGPGTEPVGRAAAQGGGGQPAPGERGPLLGPQTTSPGQDFVEKPAEQPLAEIVDLPQSKK